MKIAVMASPVFNQTKELNGEDRTIWGGAERYMLELCRMFKSHGSEVTLFQQLMPGERDGRPVLPRGMIEKEWMGFPVKCVPVSERMNGRYGAFPNFNAHFNEMAARFDLRIYFVTSMAYPAVVHPCISVSHGIYWDFAGAGVTGGMDERLETLSRMREMFMAADACVAVDHNVKNVVRAMFTGAETSIHVIPNFVDLSEFRPSVHQPDRTRKVVLFPRRFTSVRGCNDFIEASQVIPEADFVACGQADSTGTEAAIGTIPTIRYEWHEPQDMPKMYQGADIAVVPTKGAEGLSLSLLEAMACGIPVVTTMNGGLGDAVIPGYNALTYDPDHTGCDGAIRELLHNPALRIILAKRSLDVVREYDINKWRAQWWALAKRFA